MSTRDVKMRVKLGVEKKIFFLFIVEILYDLLLQ